MMKKIISSFFVLIVLSSLVFASSPKEAFKKFTPTFIDSNLVTGNMVFEAKPNNVQQIYEKSIPAIVKIIVYVDFERYMPDINYIDWDGYNRKIIFGQQPTYDDLVIDFDKSTNYFDLLENELGNEYAAHVDKFPYSTGSGFIISPDGYVLTNAHVLALRENDLKETLKNYYLYAYYLGIQDLLANDASYTNDMYLEDWAVYNFAVEHMEIRNININTQVILGVDKPSESLKAKIFTPSIVDYELGELDSETGYYDPKSFDWALLKIEGNNFPTLPIGDSDKSSVGAQVIAIGYPTVSEGYKESDNIYEFKTDMEPTLTSGYISQITYIENHKYFQVDLSVSPGNSGCPAINLDGHVVGIVTSGLLAYAGGQYNYITRINDIKERISNSVQPSPGEADKLWNDGLSSYWNGDFASASDKLNNLLSISPDYPYVKSALKQINSALSGDNAVTSKNQTTVDIKHPNLLNIAKDNSMTLVIIIILLVVLVGILLNRLNKIKKRNNI